MRLARPPRRPPAETVVALIDVVFFLLVFSLLIGRLDATAPFEVLPPEARFGSDLPGGGTTLTIAADGRLAVDGNEVPPEEAHARLVAVVQREPDRLLRINAHRDAALRHVLPLVAELERAGASNVVLVVTPGPS